MAQAAGVPVRLGRLAWVARRPRPGRPWYHGRPARGAAAVLAIAACGLLLAGRCGAGEPAAPTAPVVKEEELQREKRAFTVEFPWKDAPPPQKQPDTAAKQDTGALPDMTAGEVAFRALGSLSRVAPKPGDPNAGKEILTLTKSVEIEQSQTQSVLRGETIKVVRDLKTGQTELLQAQGNVEVVMPERSGKGQWLVYETDIETTPQGQVRIKKDEFTLKGDPRTGARAMLWQGKDVIEAMEFISDRRADTFRVRGNPVANITLPEDSGAAAAPPTDTAGTGMIPSFGFGGGGKIRLQAEGEMFYEGPRCRVTITRNVVIQQDGPGGTVAMIMSGDDALLTLAAALPGQQAQAQASVFTGSLKTLRCSGRVEIKTPSHTVLCDRATLDMQQRTFLMEMEKPKDEVRVCMRETAEGGKIMFAPRSLKIVMGSGELNAGGPMHTVSYTGAPPTNRPPQPHK
ncbi:MAG: hypothetical protein NTW87_35805 [Planctomycetota bacterium]|nr:hypothetical protein [Planctomycetota bacterium]